MATIKRMMRASVTRQRIRDAMEEKKPVEKTADWSTTALVVSSSLLFIVIVLYIVKFYL
jgi:hypothetical protein